MKTLFNFKPRRADAWTELVFEHRNHDYGAYALRRDYNRTTQKAFSLATLGLGLLFATLWFATRSTDAPMTLPGIEDGYVPTDIYTVPKTPNQLLPPSQPKTPSTNNLSATLVASEVDSTDAKLDTTSVTSSTGGNTLGRTDTTGASSGGGSNVVKPDTTSFTNKIIEFPEVMPAFPGGVDAMLKYLTKHIRCQSWQESGESGTVVLSLVINQDGSVRDVQVIRDNVGYGCAEQAAQVVRNMPRWSPGRMGDRAVSVRYILPVQYQRN